jgi:hypothetical protein
LMAARLPLILLQAVAITLDKIVPDLGLPNQVGTLIGLTVKA